MPDPSRLTRRTAAGVLLLALAACTTLEPAGDTIPAFYRRIDEGNALDLATAAGLINAHRQRNGLGPLAVDAGLSEEARRRAATVAEADTSTWGEVPRVQTASTAQRRERVSAGYRTLAEAFSGWRDSPPHNAVMLAPEGRRLGLAAVHRPGTKYQVYWAMVVTP